MPRTRKGTRKWCPWCSSATLLLSNSESIKNYWKNMQRNTEDPYSEFSKYYLIYLNSSPMFWLNSPISKIAKRPEGDSASTKFRFSEIRNAMLPFFPNSLTKMPVSWTNSSNNPMVINNRTTTINNSKWTNINVCQGCRWIWCRRILKWLPIRCIRCRKECSKIHNRI